MLGGVRAQSSGVAAKPSLRARAIHKQIHKRQQVGVHRAAQVVLNLLLRCLRQPGCVSQLPEGQRKVSMASLHQTPKVIDQRFITRLPGA